MSRNGAALARFLGATGALFTLVALVATGLDLGLPADRVVSTDVGYAQDLTVGYSAEVPAGAAYPDGMLGWGDPVYPRVVDDLDVEVRQRFRGPVTAPVHGALTLRPQVVSSTGWRGPVGPETRTALYGASAVARTRIDLRDLTRLVRRAERASGAPLGLLTVEVVATAQLRTEIAGHPVTSTVTAPLRFRLDDNQLVLLGSGPRTERTGTVQVIERQPWTVPLLDIDPAALPLHPVSLGATSAALTALLGLLILGVRTLITRRRTEFGAELARRYPDRLVHVRSVPDGPTVEVSTEIDFLLLAEFTGEVIAHRTAPGADGYELIHAGTRYRYTPDRSVPNRNAPDGNTPRWSAPDGNTPDGNPAEASPDLGSAPPVRLPSPP
ncbi:MAG: hypothetical protein P8Z68_00635 [Kineosporiaceae bacterium]